MRNSNSVTAWILRRGGVDTTQLGPPHGGRAPGWNAGLVIAARDDPVAESDPAIPRRRDERPAATTTVRARCVDVARTRLGLWHIPLFSFSAGLGTMPPIGLIGWAASIVTGSVICTWLFNSTRGSIAVLALFHAALDIFIGSPTGGDIVANVMGAFVVIGAMIIPRRFGRANLSTSAKITATTSTVASVVFGESIEAPCIGEPTTEPRPVTCRSRQAAFDRGGAATSAQRRSDVGASERFRIRTRFRS